MTMIEEMTKILLEELSKKQELDKELLEKEAPSLKPEKNKISNDENHLDEIEFLTAINERLLVLFEGLNYFDKKDIEARLELNIKFLEFLLATIANRIEDLSK